MDTSLSDFSSIPLHIDCFDDVSSNATAASITGDLTTVNKKSTLSSSAVSLGGNHFQLRVLDRMKNERTNSLAGESASFGDKIDTLSSTSAKVVDIIERYAKRIEVQKMKAIGVRNLVEGEIENRKTNKLALQSQIEEKTAEMERVKAFYDSLVLMEAEQRATIEKLSNNSAE